MRLFTAIDLPPEMVEKLSEFVNRLRPLARIEWSPLENLHITTKFIGEWPDARLAEMKAALAGVQKAGPILISVCGVGWFPGAFWAGIDGGNPLAMLAGSIEQAVAKLGIPVEKRAYAPHLTLAKVKDRVPLDSLREAAGDPDFGSFHASSFFLYLSESGRYSKLAEFSLNS